MTWRHTALVMALLGIAGSQSFATQKPNSVLILADDCRAVLIAPDFPMESVDMVFLEKIWEFLAGA